jgi:hypothetical protein
MPRQGEVDLSRPGAVAAIASRDRRRVSASGQPDQPAKGQNRIGRSLVPEVLLGTLVRWLAQRRS